MDRGRQRRAWNCSWLMAICWLAGVITLPASAEQAPNQDKIDRSSRELSELRLAIKSQRKVLRDLVQDERDTAVKYENIVKEMKLVRGLLSGLDEREKMLQQQSDSLRARLDRHQAAYAHRQQELGRHLRGLYERGPRHQLELFMTAESLSSLLTRLKYATITARLDGRIVEQARAEGLQILREQSQLQAALTGIWEAREEARQERARLQRMDEERRETLDLLQAEREQTEAELARLKTREQRLSELLTKLEEERQSHLSKQHARQSLFGRQKGTLEWPVDGEVIRSFGRSVHPEFQTVTLNNGLSIAAPLGAPVYAVASGSVEFASDLPGFGVCVILDHGDGYYSLYGHLAQVFVARGDPLNRGEILAEVGELTGEEVSQLYFEIRQGKTPLDPMAWLKPRR